MGENNMKKFFTCALLTLLLLAPGMAMAADSQTVTILGKTVGGLMTVSFPDENGAPRETLMVPLRDAAEALGITVYWYSDEQVASVKPVENDHLRKLLEVPVRNCQYFSTTIMLKDDSREIWLSDYFTTASRLLPGNSKTLVKDGKMYVPAEFFSEIMGINNFTAPPQLP